MQECTIQRQRQYWAHNRGKQTKQTKQNKYKKAKQSKANQNKKKKKTTEKISYTDQSDKNYLYCCLYMDCRWLSNYHEGSGLSSLIIMREWVVITNYHEGVGCHN